MAGLCNTSHILTVCHTVSLCVIVSGHSVAHLAQCGKPINKHPLSAPSLLSCFHCIGERHTVIYLTGNERHNKGLKPH
jgi:hypothetical protein